MIATVGIGRRLAPPASKLGCSVGESSHKTLRLACGKSLAHGTMTRLSRDDRLGEFERSGKDFGIAPPWAFWRALERAVVGDDELRSLR